MSFPLKISKLLSKSAPLHNRSENPFVRTCLHPLTVIIPKKEIGEHLWGNKVFTATTTASIFKSKQIIHRIEEKIMERLPAARSYWSKKRNHINFGWSNITLALKHLKGSCFSKLTMDAILK